MDLITIAPRFRFCFELDAVADVQAWGEPGEGSLHWFGLTSGRYWIETPAGEVFRYSLGQSEFNYVDYYVARLFEDVQEHLPHILEPVPEDVACIASNRAWLTAVGQWLEEDCDGAEGGSRWDLYDAALAWWHEREIDTQYLSHGPWISIWRTIDVIHFRWESRCNTEEGIAVPFKVMPGYFEMGIASFQDAAYGFCEEVLLAMRGRVENIQAEGWRRVDCALDVDALAADQQQRERLFASIRGKQTSRDWDGVRRYLDQLVQRVGPV